MFHIYTICSDIVAFIHYSILDRTKLNYTSYKDISENIHFQTGIKIILYLSVITRLLLYTVFIISIASLSIRNNTTGVQGIIIKHIASKCLLLHTTTTTATVNLLVLHGKATWCSNVAQLVRKKTLRFK